MASQEAAPIRESRLKLWISGVTSFLNSATMASSRRMIAGMTTRQHMNMFHCMDFTMKSRNIRKRPR